MVHDVFESNRWKQVFPLARLRSEAREFVLARKKRLPANYRNQEAVDDHIAMMEPKGDIVTGPEQIAVIQQLREERGLVKPTAGTVPTDVFVLGLGEPGKREVTKIGGLPYWPRQRPWPASAIGKPLVFLGQFCFLDSRDLVADLPGDLLLAFGTDHDAVLSCEEGAIYLVWMTVCPQELIGPAELPEADWKIEPCFGVRHRTWDYDHPDADASELHLATKIGGVIPWIQAPEDLPGKFVCSLSSVNPLCEKPYPFVNHQEPWPRFEGEFLMFGDVGRLFIFIDKGKTYWTVQCY